MDIKKNLAFKSLRREFGNDAFGFCDAIWCEGYSSGTCEVSIPNDSIRDTLAEAAMVSPELFERIATKAAELGIFDAEPWRVCRVLTSDGMRKRYAEATKDRTRKRDSSGVSPGISGNNPGTSGIPPDSFNFISSNLISSTDEDRSKVEGGLGETKPAAKPAKVAKPPELTIGEFFHCTEEAKTKFISEFGADCFDWFVTAFNGYREAHKFKSPIAAIRNWRQRAEKEKRDFYAPGAQNKQGWQSKPRNATEQMHYQTELLNKIIKGEEDGSEGNSDVFEADFEHLA